MRPFQIVENKIEETNFFLEKMENISLSEVFCIGYYFSAFISAARSITFTLQASLKDANGFPEWYKEKQTLLKENNFARFFHITRNENQKEGLYHITRGKMASGEMLFYFDDNESTYPKSDVCTSSNEYFVLLLKIIIDCYKTFGYQIDPLLYYSLEGMKRNNKTVEDFEEEIIGIRGYTYLPGCSIEQRINLLKQNIPMPKIDYVFLKRLKCDRFGEKVNFT